jgi:hypothetical protein
VKNAGSEDLVEVWRAWGDSEVRLVRGLLETEGIESAIRGESTRLTHGFTLDGLAEVRILVYREDAARALELIAEAEGMGSCPECEMPVQRSDRACRFCGAPTGRAEP